MSLETDIRDVLSGDSTLSTWLTGGIYAKSKMGRKGLTRDNPRTPDAFQDQTVGGASRPILHPCLVVRDRGETPDGQRWDTKSQTQSVQSVIELWYYDHEDYDTIQQARQRVYQLLQATTHAHIGVLSRINTINNQRAQELNDAALLRDDYRVTRIHTGGS